MKLPLFFVLLLAAAWAGIEVIALLENDAGYILISYDTTTIEMTLLVGMILIVCTAVILFASIWLVLRLFSSRGAIFSWFGRRSIKLNRQQTTKGLIDFTEGNWGSAKRQLIQSAAKAETPIINYLMAARASSMIGDFADSEECLREADKIKGATIAVGVTQAQIQLDNGRLEQCLATLMRIKEKSPRHKAVLNMLKKVYIRLQDWRNLENLLPELKKSKILDNAELLTLEHTTYRGLLNDYIAKSHRQNITMDDELIDAWKRAPVQVKKDPDMVALYVDALLAYDKGFQAESVLCSALNKQWHDDLVVKYGYVQGRDLKKQLLSGEKWLQERPNNAALLLTLGRLALNNQMWLKAREYFENSLRLSRTPEVLGELGRLSAQLDEYEKSADYFSQSILAGAMKLGLPNLPMPKSTAQHIDQVEPAV